MVNSTIANFFAIVLQYNSKVRIVLEHYSKKNINIYIYIYILFHRFFSLSSFSALFSLLSSLFRPKHHIFSLFLLSSFSVGSGVWVVGRGLWLGCGSGVWVVGDGVGQ